MVPVTRASTHKEEDGEKNVIAVFLLRKLRTSVINNFLDQAYSNYDGNLELCIVWTKDLLQITSPSRPPVQDYQASLESDHFNHEYHEILAEHPRLMEDRWLVLDSESAHTETLQLEWRWQEEPDGPASRHPSSYSIRIDFPSSLQYSATLGPRSRVSSLTRINSAQVCGGVLRTNLLQSITQMPTIVSLEDFPPDPKWEECVTDLDNGDPLWPMFCTAQIPLQVLNKFITESLGHSIVKVIKESLGPQPRLAIVTDLDPVKYETVDGPLESSPPIPPQVFGATPEILRAIVKSRFKETKLHKIQFIILDVFSAKGETALIADEGINATNGLELARARFSMAVVNLNACGPTSLSLRGIAESGAMKKYGVVDEFE